MTCLFFVTSAIIEFAVLLHLKSATKYKKQLCLTSVSATRKRFKEQDSAEPMNQGLQIENNKMGNNDFQLESHSHKKEDRLKTGQGRSFQERARKIDRITLNTFTASFILFNFIYWAYYLKLIECIKNY